MTPAQVAANHRAVANLAETLSRWNLTDPQQRAEHICRQLADDGWRPLEPAPPLRGPTSSGRGRAAARELAAQAIRDAKIKGGRA